MSSPAPLSPRSVIHMTEPASSESIDADVDRAYEKFKALHQKLKHVIGATKAQHATMLALNEQRMNTAKQIEAFMIDTPLARVTGSLETEEARSTVFVRKLSTPSITDVESPELDRKGPVDLDDSMDSLSESSEGEETQKHANTVTESKEAFQWGSAADEAMKEMNGKAEEANEVTDDKEVDEANLTNQEDLNVNSHHDDEEVAKLEADTTEVKDPPSEETEEIPTTPADETKNTADTSTIDALRAAGLSEAEVESQRIAMQNIEQHSGQTLPTSPAASKSSTVPENNHQGPPPSVFLDPLVGKQGSDFSEIENSYVAIHDASHKLSNLYMDQYNANLIGYLEEWEKTVSSRIQARLIEYEKLRHTLSHYVQKVEALRETVNKQKEANKPVKPKVTEKLARNELKLSGARETHDNTGESLFLYMDEVTDRAWRDAYPVLMMALQFDANYSIDQAKIFSRLRKTADMLQEVSIKKEITPGGRLKALKKTHPELIYTGPRDMIRPVIGKSCSDLQSV